MARLAHRLPAAPAFRVQAGARVISNSYEGDCWGTPCYSQLERDAIRGLAASALFVTSAGNKGVDADVRAHYPSGYDSPNIVSVASSNQQDRLSSFSNRGRCARAQRGAAAAGRQDSAAGLL